MSILRDKLNAEKIRLYQAILDIDYRHLTDNEVEIGFLLGKDDFIRGLINEAIEKERAEYQQKPPGPADYPRPTGYNPKG